MAHSARSTTSMRSRESVPRGWSSSESWSHREGSVPRPVRAPRPRGRAVHGTGRITGGPCRRHLDARGCFTAVIASVAVDDQRRRLVALGLALTADSGGAVSGSTPSTGACSRPASVRWVRRMIHVSATGKKAYCSPLVTQGTFPNTGPDEVLWQWVSLTWCRGRVCQPRRPGGPRSF
jgi:hypothetical protein